MRRRSAAPLRKYKEPKSKTPKSSNKSVGRTVPFLAGIQSYFFLHAHTFVASLGRIYRAPVASAMTILVIAAALALPVSFYVLVKNALQASTGLETTNQISLFLKPDISDETGRRISERLENHAKIAQVKLISKEAGLKEFQTYSGFGEALQALDFNPLPVVISIKPKDSLTKPEDVERLLAELKSLAETDLVQLDTQWMRKLHHMLSFVERSIVVLGILLSFAVLFIVANTIRLELQNRQEEIAVTKLMGATNRFIRRPFLYTGFWYGFLGGLIAWFLVTFLFLLLRGPVRELAVLYDSHFDLDFMSFSDFISLLSFAAGLGIVGSVAVVEFHLKKLDPE